LNLVPVIVTGVPTVPTEGVNPVMVGGYLTVNDPALCPVPAAVVTLIFPVSRRPAPWRHGRGRVVGDASGEASWRFTKSLELSAWISHFRNLRYWATTTGLNLVIRF
jgi:hypothetical protein